MKKSLYEKVKFTNNNPENKIPRQRNTYIEDFL